ncbi:NAD(P)/FAD-dependent oxidoreductase [Maribacter sp. CXY002]|uniref:NAD(P)/FAD-dependent oxidoreductase n=1 Tax=Maribacter luteocoastalis TaxID=3407671 RepID=UPI003B6701DD
MNLSYWEYKSWLSNIDFTIIGSGIVGINCALQLRKRYPKAKIVILERGILPQGASTKNAGFACFGSISEILADLNHHSEEELVNLVKERKEGVQTLRELLGDQNIGFQLHGGHELFMEKHGELYEHCVSQIKYLNGLLQPVFKGNTFTVTPNTFNFKSIEDSYITHNYEGQINTGEMMRSLLDLAHKSNIAILNAITVTSVHDTGTSVSVKTNNFEFKSTKVLIATNGFANQLINEEVKPARAQVLITKPIANLHIKGTFHLEEGYYYFRNIDDRILLGGGRNLDFATEETDEFGNTEIIQDKLKELLSTVILPRTPFEIDYSWSGIMGVGHQKKPIVKQLSNNLACGVRLGGMGIAIGTGIGQKLAYIF